MLLRGKSQLIGRQSRSVLRRMWETSATLACGAIDKAHCGLRARLGCNEARGIFTQSPIIPDDGEEIDVRRDENKFIANCRFSNENVVVIVPLALVESVKIGFHIGKHVVIRAPICLSPSRNIPNQGFGGDDSAARFRYDPRS